MSSTVVTFDKPGQEKEDCLPLSHVWEELPYIGQVLDNGLSLY